MNDVQERIKRLTPAQQALLRQRVDQAQSTAEPIAIVGLSCRFPGAADERAFWNLLREGVDAISEIPADRWQSERIYDPRPALPGFTNTRWGGFLKDIDDFDADFFSISQREAERLDPQQRLLLEVAWEALENSGESPHALAGSQLGIFLGICGSDFGRLNSQRLDQVDAYLATGSAPSIAANRLSYVLDARGPSLAIDTACSSSLVAIHLACQSLLKGECPVALAGGVNLLLAPDMMVAFSQARMMAADGRCKTFDSKADGYVRGEGCGILVLKRLSDAKAHGDTIRAVIRGSAINQDGRSNGLTAPNGLAQQAVIRQALSNARLSPAQIDFVEVHGTGTPLGDPIEVEALKAVLLQGRPANRPCALASVKTNIGHLEAAAGIAGLIKVVLAMEHAEIPAHLHLRELNPRIRLDATLLMVPTKHIPWTTPDSRRAGVSSFGFGGTNAHIILEQAPPPTPSPATAGTPWIIPLSARSASALKQVAERLAAAIEINPGFTLADIAWTSQVGRAQFDHRLAIVTRSTEDLRAQCAAFSQGVPAPGAISAVATSSTKNPRIAFIFNGGEGQHVEPRRRLYEDEPVFRKASDDCQRLLASQIGQCPASDQSGQAHIARHANSQTAHFVFGYALAQLWRSWGIEPHVVMGHGIGEYIAACIAGALKLADALLMTVAGDQLKQVSSQRYCQMTVFAPEQHVLELLSSHPSSIRIVAINNLRETEIIGTEQDLVAFAARAQHLETRLDAIPDGATLPSSAESLSTFRAAISRITISKPSLIMVSTVTGKVVDPHGLADPEHWYRHLTQPVRFAEGMRSVATTGCTLFVEVGPEPRLANHAQATIGTDLGRWLSPSTTAGDDQSQRLNSLAELWIHGVDIRWHALHDPAQRRRLALPTYPFERRRIPRSPALLSVDTNDSCAAALTDGHPLLGCRLSSPVHSDIAYESAIEPQKLTWLRDHCIWQRPLFPAAAFLEMAIATAEMTPHSHVVLTQVSFIKPLVLGTVKIVLQTIVESADAMGAKSFNIFSRQGDRPIADRSDWILHARGTVAKVSDQEAPVATSLDERRARCNQSVPIPDLYRRLSDHGLSYGPAFQGIVALWKSDGEALASIVLPSALRTSVSPYGIHPALLDACCQTLACLALPPNQSSDRDDSSTFVPTGCESMQLFCAIAGEVWCAVRLRDATTSEQYLVGDLILMDVQGKHVGSLAGLRMTKVSRRLLFGDADAVVTSEVSGAPAATLPRAARPRPLVDHLATLAPDERPAYLSGFLTERAAVILGVSMEKVDSAQPLNTMGFDSLMATDLSIEIEDAVGVVLTLERFRDAPTIKQLTDEILADIQWTAQIPRDDIDSMVDGMSDAEVVELLRQHLPGSGS